MSRHEPFGYIKTKTGLEPVSDQLEALTKAKFYLESGCSMYAVRDWLVNKTGRQITVPGLLKVLKFDGRNKTYSQEEDQDKNTEAYSQPEKVAPASRREEKGSS